MCLFGARLTAKPSRGEKLVLCAALISIMSFLFVLNVIKIQEAAPDPETHLRSSDRLEKYYFNFSGEFPLGDDSMSFIRRQFFCCLEPLRRISKMRTMMK